jgi:hypothetical protein
MDPNGMSLDLPRIFDMLSPVVLKAHEIILAIKTPDGDLKDFQNQTKAHLEVFMTWMKSIDAPLPSNSGQAKLRTYFLNNGVKFERLNHMVSVLADNAVGVKNLLEVRNTKAQGIFDMNLKREIPTMWQLLKAQGITVSNLEASRSPDKNLVKNIKSYTMLKFIYCGYIEEQLRGVLMQLERYDKSVKNIREALVSTSSSPICKVKLNLQLILFNGVRWHFYIRVSKTATFSGDSNDTLHGPSSKA